MDEVSASTQGPLIEPLGLLGICSDEQSAHSASGVDGSPVPRNKEHLPIQGASWLESEIKADRFDLYQELQTELYRFTLGGIPARSRSGCLRQGCLLHL